MEMKKCAECGKPFTGRGKYCSDVHYRPCPMCGAPAVVKYFSDPPRRCDNCLGKKKAPTGNRQLFNINNDESFKPGAPEPKKVDIEYVTEIPATIGTAEFCEQMTGIVRTYIGPELKDSFVPGHDYLMKVEHDEYTYGVSSTQDLTSDEDVNIFRNYSSQISFHQQFVRKVGA